MKLQFIINAQEAFLLDTAEHFHSGNRSVLESGTCKYAPASQFTCGCAVGRHVPNKILCVQMDNAGESGVRSDNVWSNLPGQLQVLGPNFLDDVQDLHDNTENWTPKGLSEKGVATVRYICRSHGLNPDSVLR